MSKLLEPDFWVALWSELFKPDRCWQPNRGRRSTYRRGKTVQTTETTSRHRSNSPVADTLSAPHH